MVDEPNCPGVGPYLNQPTAWVVAGTMIWPSGCKPSVPTVVETLIAGMTSPIGTECLSALIAVPEPAGRFVVVVVVGAVVVAIEPLPGPVLDRAPITEPAAMTTTATPSTHHLRSTLNVRSRTTRVAVSTSSCSAQSATASAEGRGAGRDRNGEGPETDQT